MKALQKVSKFLSDYTSIVVIAIAVITFFVPGMMAWVNNMLFVDFDMMNVVHNMLGLLLIDEYVFLI